MLSNHLNYFGLHGEVYCEMKNQLIFLATDKKGYFGNVCRKCPYFSGVLQGNGIECQYRDSLAKDYITVVTSPMEFMQKRERAREKERNTKHIIKGGE